MIVLLVLILGFYVAYTGFFSARETLRARPTMIVSTKVAQAPPRPILLTPTVTATLVVTAMASPEVTVTSAFTPTQDLSDVSAPTSAPTASPTELPVSSPTQAPPVVPSPTITQGALPPTPLPVPAQQFRLGGPPAADPSYPNCCYIYGTVRDAAGNGLQEVQVQASNEWVAPVHAVTKSGAEMGNYDIPINAQAGTSWDIVVVDAAGNQISSKVRIEFDANVTSGYRVDWQRTY